MKQGIAVLFLLGVIFCSVLYTVLYISFNLTPENSSVRVVYRKWFISKSVLRKILRLHQIGDARYDYGSDRQYKTLEIRVFLQNGLHPEDGSMDTIKREIGRVVTKSGGIIELPTETILDSGTLFSDTQINELIRLHTVKPSPFGDTVRLNIFFLSGYTEHPTYVGLVTDAYNIFIFKDAVNDIAHLQKSSRETEVSTVLHEFGHLLGAEHIDIDGCVMSAKVEDTTFYNLPTLITDTYCNTDIDEINRAIK